jgi:hypothetical protein
MSLRWRIISVSLLVGLLAWLGLANVFSPEQREEAWWLPDEGVRLGLDLRGGVHVVLGPDFEAAFGQELGHVARNLEERFEKQGLASVRVVHEKGTIRIEAPKPSDMVAVKEELADYQTLDLEESTDEIVARLNREQQDAVQERAMQQVLEVLRRRVDDPQTGIPESVITRQGNDRAGCRRERRPAEGASSRWPARGHGRRGRAGSRHPAGALGVSRARPAGHDRRVPDGRAGLLRQRTQRVGRVLHLVGRRRPDLLGADREQHRPAPGDHPRRERLQRTDDSRAHLAAG